MKFTSLVTWIARTTRGSGRSGARPRARARSTPDVALLLLVRVVAQLELDRVARGRCSAWRARGSVWIPASPSSQKKRLSRMWSSPCGGLSRASAASVLAWSIGTSGIFGPSCPASPAGLMPILSAGPGSFGTPAAPWSPRQTFDCALAAGAASRRARTRTIRRTAPEYVYSHSIVPGGFEVMSRVTRFTWRISLIIREAMRSSRS